jgi:hypothetical protein
MPPAGAPDKDFITLDPRIRALPSESTHTIPGRTLEKLRQIKAGHFTLNSVQKPMLMAPGEEHRAIYRQLEISFPKIKDLQGV